MGSIPITRSTSYQVEIDMDTVKCDVVSPQWHDWHSIEWHSVSIRVRRLQVRIAKATKECNWRRVRQLQRLLTRSTSAKALAVKRVTENRGHKTPGVDGVAWSTPNAKVLALNSLLPRGYKAKPLRRIHIPKASGGKRPPGRARPSHADSCGTRQRFC